MPLFYAKDDTPPINGLTGNLLTNNPNLFNPVRLGREDAYTCSLNHDYTSEQKAVNGGLMDKFVRATSRTGTGCATDVVKCGPCWINGLRLRWPSHSLAGQCAQ